MTQPTRVSAEQLNGLIAATFEAKPAAVLAGKTFGPQLHESKYWRITLHTTERGERQRCWESRLDYCNSIAAAWQLKEILRNSVGIEHDRFCEYVSFVLPPMLSLTEAQAATELCKLFLYARTGIRYELNNIQNTLEANDESRVSRNRTFYDGIPD